MDCNTAGGLLAFIGELDHAEVGALEAHLNTCPACQARRDVQRRLDERLGQAMRDVPLPEGLRAGILGRLAAERDAFYRRWLVRAAGVAALVLLTAWLSWHWFTRPAALDLPALAMQVAAQKEAPPERVEAWLRQIGGADLAAPPDFQYSLLAAWGLDQVQGWQVPFLLFVRGDQGGGQWARVYVVDARRFRFDVEELRRQAESLSGGNDLTARVLPGETEGVVYVVFFTGPSLERFRQQPGVLT